MVYLLMGNIAWGFIAVYQAVSNCRREHQNQIKRQYKIYSAVKSVSFIKRSRKIKAKHFRPQGLEIIIVRNPQL